MAKRFISIFIALMLVCTGALLTSCKTNNDTSSTESGQTEKTAEELFTEASVSFLKNTYTGLSKDYFGDYGAFAPAENGKYDLEAGIDIDKLSIQGTDLCSDGNITLGISGGFAGTDSCLLDIALTLAGETAAAKLTGVEGEYYFEIPGVTEKPIHISGAADADSDDSSASEESGQAAVISEASMVPEIIAMAKKYVQLFIDNLPDTSFAKETKSVTVNGISFDNATVVTFNMTKEDFASVSEKLKTAMKADEDLKALVAKLNADDGSFDFDKEIDDMLAESIALSASVTISEGNAIAFGCELTMPENKGDTSDDSSSDSFVDIEKLALDAYTTTASGVTVTSVKLDADGKNILSFENKKTVSGGDKADYELSAAVCDEDGKNIVTLSLKASDGDEGKSGSLSVSIDTGEDAQGIVKISADYTSKTSDGCIEFSTEELTITTGGMDVTIPAVITVKVKCSEESIELSASIAVSVAQAIDFSGRFTMSIKKNDSFTVSAPTDFDESENTDVNALITAFMTNYPGIAAFISQLTQSDETSYVNESGDAFIFYQNGTGNVTCNYSIVSDNGKTAVIEFSNGKKVSLAYSDADEDSVKINGTEFALERTEGEYASDRAYAVWSYENYGVQLGLQLFQYSEYSVGALSCDFIYTVVDDKLTIMAADGTETEFSFEIAENGYIIGGTAFTLSTFTG